MQGSVTRFADYCQAVQRPDGGHTMRRICALMPAACAQTSVGNAVEHRGQQAFFSGTDKQTRAPGAEEGKVKPGIGQVKPEGVLPVKATAHRLGRVSVSEVLAQWHEGDESQAPRRCAVMT